jgi:hypothetical protein
MAEMIRKLVGNLPYHIPDDAARSIRRANLDDAFGGVAPHPTDIKAADAGVVAKTQEHIQDTKDYGGWPLMPFGLTADLVESSGTGRAARVGNDVLWDHISENGNYTNKLNNTLTGNAPTVRYREPISTASGVDSRAPEFLGASQDTAVTRIAPWRLLDGMTGDRAQSDRILSRIPQRNHPDGDNNATVYHLGDLEKEWKRKWLLFRGLGDTSFGGRDGVASAINKQMYYNAFTDPYVRGQGTPGTGNFNVGWHEGVHGILDAINPSRKFMVNQQLRPAVTDRQWELGPDAGYLGSNGTELSNLIFHLKRQTEITHPGMRDVGVDRNATDNFIDFVRQYEATGADPLIDLPGHRQLGQPAHGYESGMQRLQEIIDAAGPDGKKDIKDMSYDTGATNPSLRTKLLA